MATFKKPFQMDRPLFVRIPFRAGSRSWSKGQVFPWKELAMNGPKVERLYVQGYVIHNEVKEVEAAVGDGLEAMDIPTLHQLVDTLNTKVREKSTSEADFNKYKVKKSKLGPKQRGLIRSWRRNFSDKYESE